MDMEQSKNTTTYIELLKDTLERKLLVISELLSLTKQQNDVLKSESFDEEQFNDLMNQKGAMLERLEQLDTGFDRTYQLISDEVLKRKERYRNEILLLQELIRKITDVSVNIQALEQRNRDAMSVVLSQKRREIKNFKTQSNVATNYYKNMSNQHDTQSIFYDTKK